MKLQRLGLGSHLLTASHPFDLLQLGFDLIHRHTP